MMLALAPTLIYRRVRVLVSLSVYNNHSGYTIFYVSLQLCSLSLHDRGDNYL